MSLKGKIIVITLITIVTLVGVGFATWTFTGSEESAYNISGYATAAIEANGLDVKNSDGSATVNNLYIICDSQSNHGIYWSTTNDATALQLIQEHLLVLMLVKLAHGFQ